MRYLQRVYETVRVYQQNINRKDWAKDNASLVKAYAEIIDTEKKGSEIILYDVELYKWLMSLKY